MNNKQMMHSLEIAKHRLLCIGEHREVKFGIFSADFVTTVNEVKQREAIVHVEYVIEELSRRLSQSLTAKKSTKKGGQ